MKRPTLYLGLAAFVLVLVIWLGWTHSLKPAGQTAAASQQTAAVAAKRADTPINVVGSSFKPVPIPTKQPVVMDPNRLDDEAFMARVKRHMQLRYYDESPAKDTPEAVEIRGMLERIGIGREAVPEAYNGVWNYQLQVRLWEKAGRPEGGDATAILFREGTMARMQEKFGITNIEFFDRLFQMKPTVFWGLDNFQVPNSRAELLE